MEPAPPSVEIAPAKVEAALDRSRAVLSEEDYGALRAVVGRARAQATQIDAQAALIRKQAEKIRALEADLARLIHKFKSEKGQDVLDQNGSGATPPQGAPTAAGGDAGACDGPQPAGGDRPAPSDADPHDVPAAPAEGSAADAEGDSGKKKKKKRRGHGRIPKGAYKDAERIPVPIKKDLRPGYQCPGCSKGTLYRFPPDELLRLFGCSPLCAKCWVREQTRCNACGLVYTAERPAEAGDGSKYDETAAAMLALLRYGYGLPGYRLAKLLEALSTPVRATTQWHVLNERVELIKPAYQELARLAAQGSFFHNDDTSARILEHMGKRRALKAARGELKDPHRTGLFTTAIVSITDFGKIVLFYTGRRHAGENFTALLEQRAACLAKPGHMCDGLAHNRPKGHEVDEGNCLAHARRHVVDQIANLPAECAHVLDALARIYAVDKRGKLEKLSAEERLQAHQLASGPVMDKLKTWMTAQLDEKRIEPNSGLGKAFRYMLTRWEPLTLFLRRAGAALDNNICEQAFKRVIMYRKNSLFYLTERGALVGDMYTSLIHTAVLHHEDPFDYLTALLVHAKAVAAAPGDWMPWSYRKTLAAISAAASVGAQVAASADAAVNAATEAAAAEAAATSPFAESPQPQDAADANGAADLAEGDDDTIAASSPPCVAVDPAAMSITPPGRPFPPAHMFLTLLLFVLLRLDWAHVGGPVPVGVASAGPAPAVIASARPASAARAEPIVATPGPPLPDTS